MDLPQSVGSDRKLPRPSILGLLPTLAVLGSVCLLSGGCTVDTEIARELPPPYFSCLSDDDCLSGFQCEGAEGETPGRCVPRGVDGNNDCRDVDQDSYVAGSGCTSVPPEQLDCDDDNPDVHPGADEECNGEDDDCDDVIDEDVPPRNCPLQAGPCQGATRACVGGEFQDCIEEGLYGPDFENVLQADETCNGIDDNCSGDYPAGATPLQIDHHCDCIPGLTGPSDCGPPEGYCERGVQFCRDDGTFSDCLRADAGTACVDDTDCGGNAYCIDEVLEGYEDYFDDCIIRTQPECARTICRILPGSQSCTSEGDCSATETCLMGFCQPLATEAAEEECNGQDDDCDGMIDEAGACATCPYNMALVTSPLLPASGICIDKYEASRPDATTDNAGSFELWATTRENVLPWTGLSVTDAEEVCLGDRVNSIHPQTVPPRRLCNNLELEAACGNNYPYGADFVPGDCNDASTGFDLDPTGANSQCCNSGICDVSGNTAEYSRAGVVGSVQGGSTETGEADELRCDAVMVPSDTNFPASQYIGFRCCAVPSN